MKALLTAVLLLASALPAALAKRRSPRLRSMTNASGLREHPRQYLTLSDLLRGRSHQRQSLQGGVDEHRRWLLQEEERSSRNPVINLGPALKPLLAVLVLASAVAAPVFAEESGTFKEHLLLRPQKWHHLRAAEHSVNVLR